MSPSLIQDGPKTIKTYINRPSTLSFEDSTPAIETLEFSLTDLQPDTPPTALRFVKYQGVTHLTLFVTDGHDDDVTSIERVELYGTPIEATKPISEMKDEGCKH